MISPDPDDIRFMHIALREARKGVGRTSPNPCVGAVIVKDGVVISRGYHKKAGTPHAEVHAIRRAGRDAEGATIYVTLEPCSHTGKTPPCCHAVVKAGIKRVVVGMEDPNPLVSGSGNRYLREHGLDVQCGVLEEECYELNRPFLKHIATGLPFVVMKAGISLDGKLSYQKGCPGRITGRCSSKRVHRLRDSLDAILVGIGTVVADNPSLTTRVPGKKGRDPVRVILDSSLKIPLQSKVIQQESSSTLVFCSNVASEGKKERLRNQTNVRVIEVDSDESRGLDLETVLQKLGGLGLCSVLVEGGAGVHGSFLRKNLVDRVMLFQAPIFAGSAGTPLLEGFRVEDRDSAPRLKKMHYRRCGQDILIQGDL